VFVGPANAGDGEWVLIDAGLPASANDIRSAARARFGANGRPYAIIMTHGHFDHVGALESLASEWDVPVYAHARELPYLNGTPFSRTCFLLAGSRQEFDRGRRFHHHQVVTGHGEAMSGPEMRKALEELAARFDEVAVPHAAHD
jgi:glyoxylase-like metal-dependent hydrolase (beta-lactamase superfamily II)